MEKMDEVIQIMSILIVLSMETMHLTFVSFSFIQAGSNNLDIKQSFIADDKEREEVVEDDNKQESSNDDDDEEDEDDGDLFDSVCAICDNGGELLW